LALFRDNKKAAYSLTTKFEMSIFQKHSKFSTYTTTLNFSLTIIEYYDANDVKISTDINS